MSVHHIEQVEFPNYWSGEILVKSVLRVGVDGCDGNLIFARFGRVAMFPNLAEASLLD